MNYLIIAARQRRKRMMSEENKIFLKINNKEIPLLDTQVL